MSYTITVTDTGPTAYTAATITDPLGRRAERRRLQQRRGRDQRHRQLHQPGPVLDRGLAPGDTVTITYTITVNNPDTGDKNLVNTVISTTQGSNCPPGSTDPACTATVTELIPALTITAAATPATATPGGTVTYTLTVTDTGQTPYTGATITDPLAGVLDDAAYNGDATTTTTTGTGTAPPAPCRTPAWP